MGSETLIWQQKRPFDSKGHSTYCVLSSFQVSHTPKAKVCVSGIVPICANKASHPCDKQTQTQGSSKHLFLSAAFKVIK